MTPAIRLLQQKKITHRALEYHHDPANSSYGMEAAEALGLDPSLVFKTLLVTLAGGKAEHAVAIVPVNQQLDLKAIASACGAKKATMCDPKIAERMTGYIVGGISPLAQKKRLSTVIDSSAESKPQVYVSGGKRGLDIELSAIDLAQLTNAKFYSIAR